MTKERYLAFTSDVGEAFRPVAHPFLVSGAYAVSWLYCIGDVAFEGYKEYTRGGTNQVIFYLFLSFFLFYLLFSLSLSLFF